MSTSLFHTMLSAALKQETSLYLQLPAHADLPILGKKTLEALADLTQELSQKITNPEENSVAHFLLDSSALFKRAANLAAEKPLLPMLRQADHFSLGQDVYVKVYVPADGQTVQCIGFQKGVVKSVSNETFQSQHPSISNWVAVSLHEGLQSGEMVREIMSLCSDQVLSESEFLYLSQTAGLSFHTYWRLNAVGGGGPFEVKKVLACV